MKICEIFIQSRFMTFFSKYDKNIFEVCVKKLKQRQNLSNPGTDKVNYRDSCGD